MDTNNDEIKIPEEEFLVSKTDLKGVITYCNREFMEIAGYKESELIDQPHNIIRHKDMPRCVFKLLWEYIEQKREIFAFVKNRAKSGKYYWVYANVTASIDSQGNIIGYYSVRRKPNEEALKIMEGLYKVLRQKEEQGGMDEAIKTLNALLEEKEMSYNELIVGLQHGKVRM